MAVPVALTWTARLEPLRPAAILGRGSVAATLAGVLADRLDAGVDLEVHAGEGVVLAIGDERDLPWVDGATWLGRDGTLLCPTTLRPALDLGLVSRAVGHRVGADAGWIVLTPEGILAGRHATGVADGAGLRRLADASGPS